MVGPEGNNPAAVLQGGAQIGSGVHRQEPGDAAEIDRSLKVGIVAGLGSGTIPDRLAFKTRQRIVSP